MLLGLRSSLVANQDPLLPPAEIFVHDECGGVLVFRSENQGCAFWGVRLNDLDQDDPPVFVQARHGWVPFLDRVSLACVELVLNEALFGGGGRLYNACELPADLLEAVPERFQRVALPTTRCGRGRRTFQCVGSPPRDSCYAWTAWTPTAGCTSGAGPGRIWRRSARPSPDGGPWDTPSHWMPDRCLFNPHDSGRLCGRSRGESGACAVRDGWGRRRGPCRRAGVGTPSGPGLPTVGPLPVGAAERMRRPEVSARNRGSADRGRDHNAGRQVRVGRDAMMLTLRRQT
ncbi:hypothetical protein SUDANB148_04405 [Streptomyces sp. SudanB148_2056]